MSSGSTRNEYYPRFIQERKGGIRAFKAAALLEAWNRQSGAWSTEAPGPEPGHFRGLCCLRGAGPARATLLCSQPGAERVGNASAGGGRGVDQGPSVPQGSWPSPKGREGSPLPKSNTEEALRDEPANSPPGNHRCCAGVGEGGGRGECPAQTPALERLVPSPKVTPEKRGPSSLSAPALSLPPGDRPLYSPVCAPSCS